MYEQIESQFCLFKHIILYDFYDGQIEQCSKRIPGYLVYPQDFLTVRVRCPTIRYTWNLRRLQTAVHVRRARRSNPLYQDASF